MSEISLDRSLHLRDRLGGNAIEDVEAVASWLEHLAGDLQEVLEKFEQPDNELTETVDSVILDLFGEADQLNDWCDRIKEELSL